MLYQHTAAASKNNAFCWDDGAPSIFAADTAFTPLGKQRLSRQELATQAIDRYEAETGVNRGTIRHLTAKSEKALKPRWGSAYLKPGGAA